MNRTKGSETAVLGGGCFWCLEAIYERLDGVIEVRSGYAGGHTKNPTYEEVCSGTTGHAEVVEITYDPKITTYEHILDVFWQAHDPTTLNRQGADVGTQYRSIILYNSEDQRKAAEESKKAMDTSGKYSNPIVTEIQPLEEFYPAEQYHQDYYNNNKNAGYCRLVILPKLQKLEME